MDQIVPFYAVPVALFRVAEAGYVDLANGIPYRIGKMGTAIGIE